jgi:hypothetical protein
MSIGTGFYVSSIYEYIFKQIGIFKSTCIVLTKGREVGNLFMHSVAKIPAISKVDFDIFDCLSHGTNSKDILNHKFFY